MTIWTVGHSTRTREEFTALLLSFGIESVADVRSFPGSRKHPQFNKENMEVWLPQAGIRYTNIPQLGGRRRPDPGSLNTMWRHPAFRAYADYMETPGFREGMDILTGMARECRTAFMCSEALWWRCHRSMISDQLKSEGWEVIHIMGPDKSEEHPYTKAARIEGGRLTYRGLL